VPTTLGRGGSDTSAALLGSALDAEEIEIWTDVDGLMTADPRLVPSARTLPRIRFAEAAELTLHGARVLHPAAVAPAVERQIPVRVLNSLNPACAGTVIVGSAEDTPAMAGVASREGVHVLRVVSPRLQIDPGLPSRVLAEVGRLGAGIDLVAASEISLAAVLRAPLDPAALASAIEADVEDVRIGPAAILCVVGAGLRTDAGLRGRVLEALARLAPPVIASGTSASTVVAVVEQARLRESVHRVHERFFGAEA